LRRLGFATCSSEAELTADDRRTEEALHRLGFSLEPVVWDHGPLETGRLAGLIMRSCWNYHLHPQAFVAWLEAVAQGGTPIWNSPAITRWNLHKGYLAELERGGASLPQTLWIPQGGPASLQKLLLEHGLDEVVVKPQISLSAWSTFRSSPAQAPAHQSAFEAVVAHSGAIVQAFVPEVQQTGEVSLVYLGGTFSHALRKRPKVGDFRVQGEFGATREAFQPTPSLLAQADAILAQVQEPLLFARVDGIERGERLLLMELELIDPYLFLELAPGSEERFARAIAEVIG
jgi:hypothetical protein